jgi:probable addiction module antidote protein
MRKMRSFDEYLDEHLRNPIDAAHYLNACLEEKDPLLILEALKDIARAHGVSRLAKRVSMSRTGLHKTLSRNGNPEFKTLIKILDASGIVMEFKPKPKHAA